MAYEDIQIPILGQPASPSLFGEKVRNAILDLDARMSVLEAAQTLPDAASVTGFGVNSVTAAADVWQTLSPNGVSLVYTNPSDAFNLRCLVLFGCWMDCDNGAVRMSLNITGGVVSNPEPGTNSPAGFGMVPIEGDNAVVSQHMGMFQLVIPAGAAAVTLTGQGQRNLASGSQQVNYPTIDLIPWRYEIP